MRMSGHRIIIDLPEFSNSVRGVLLDFSDNVNAELTKAAQRAANRTRAEIKQYAPKRTGVYAKSWAVKKDFSDYSNKKRPTFIVYAKKPGYQLAHLLERGHRVVNQHGEYGYLWGYPHIEPACDQNITRFEQDVRNIFMNLS